MDSISSAFGVVTASYYKTDHNAYICIDCNLYNSKLAFQGSCHESKNIDIHRLNNVQNFHFN